MIMHRFYATLKRQCDYKKHVRWIEKVPSCMPIECKDKAVVEYLGTFPRHPSTHGNSKRGSESEYVRTREIVMQRKSKNVQFKQPRDVYARMLLKDPDNAPRNLRQVQNIRKSTLHKKEGKVR